MIRNETKLQEVSERHGLIVFDIIGTDTKTFLSYNSTTLFDTLKKDYLPFQKLRPVLNHVLKMGQDLFSIKKMTIAIVM
jgi:hypothetical protein